MNLKKLLGGTVLVLAAIQLVPYGRDHLNPPVTGEPAWDSPRTQELFSRACKDCHSNNTVWPWYSNVAPASWLAALDVSVGRKKFNVSEWGRAEKMKAMKLPERFGKERCPPGSTFPPIRKRN